MSMNTYMHPRNPYRNPPDFTQLAVAYPEIRAIGTLDVNGKVRLDFQHDQTLRTLTACLLHRDFGLRVHLPVDKLVPTLPLRLNYILWLEDVLRAANVASNAPTITGIDIGCGASCIYPLLAARTNPNWRMFALESNAHSAEHARANVTANELASHIEIVTQQSAAGGERIFDSLLQVLKAHSPDAAVAPQIADFCMCNPPFFNASLPSAAPPAPLNRTGHRPAPRVRLCTAASSTESTTADTPSPSTSNAVIIASADELASVGGEVAFVGQIIAESCELRTRIHVYSTMLGQKSSVAKVLRLLGERGVLNVCRTEFCQGRTTRWGVAWSFDERVQLSTVPATGPTCGPSAGAPTSAGSNGKRKSFAFSIPPPAQESGTQSVGGLLLRLESIFSAIGLQLADTQHVSVDLWLGKVVALSNCWSNQRRRRREMLRTAAAAKQAVDALADSMMPDALHVSDNYSSPASSSGQRRKHKVNEDEESFYDDEGRQHENGPMLSVKRMRMVGADQPSAEIVLCVQLSLLHDRQTGTFTFDMEYVSGTAGRDGAYQLMQFVQNQWK